MHLDLWPAPMRAGLCGGSRLPICGGVASTPDFGGRQRPKQALAIFVKATRRGTKARRGSDRRHRDVDGRYGAIQRGFNGLVALV